MFSSRHVYTTTSTRPNPSTPIVTKRSSSSESSSRTVTALSSSSASTASAKSTLCFRRLERLFVSSHSYATAPVYVRAYAHASAPCNSEFPDQWQRLQKAELGKAVASVQVRMSDMQIALGKVVDGRVVVEGDLPEGAEVTLLALDGEQEFEVDAALEAVLLDSIVQGRRGETIPAEELLREMRGRDQR